ncbi:MAG: hypothetical protein ACXADA_02940 [Candidatus Hodarchaeales archaeon]
MVTVARFEKIALDDHDRDLLVCATKLVFHELINLLTPRYKKQPIIFKNNVSNRRREFV